MPVMEQTVFYEIYLPQWGDGNSFENIEQRIDHLRSLFVQCVILSPIQPPSERMKIGELGSPWAISDYRAINPLLGSEAALKSMINQFHNYGIKVIMDWYPLTTAYDSPLYEFALDTPEAQKLLQNRHNFSYNDVTALDFENESLKEDILDDMQFWLETYQLDGFRVHQLDHLPDDFVNDILSSSEIITISGEDSKKDYGLPTLNYDLYDALIEGIEKDLPIADIEAALLNVDDDGQQPINFTSNTLIQTQKGTNYSTFGQRYKMAVAIAFVSHGHTLLLGGQELPLRQNLSLYQHRPFIWPDKNISDFYRELILLKGRNKALQMGREISTRIISTNNPHVICVEKIYEGHRFVGIFNFSNEKQTILLEENMFNVNDYKMNRPINIRANEEFKIASMQFLLFSNV